MQAARKALSQPDSIMNNNTIKHVTTWMSHKGDPKELLSLLADSYHGFAQQCNILCHWMLLSGIPIESIYNSIHRYFFKLIDERFDSNSADLPPDSLFKSQIWYLVCLMLIRRDSSEPNWSRSFGNTFYHFVVVKLFEFNRLDHLVTIVNRPHFQIRYIPVLSYKCISLFSSLLQPKMKYFDQSAYYNDQINQLYQITFSSYQSFVFVHCYLETLLKLLPKNHILPYIKNRIFSQFSASTVTKSFLPHNLFINSPLCPLRNNVLDFLNQSENLWWEWHQSLNNLQKNIQVVQPTDQEESHHSFDESNENSLSKTQSISASSATQVKLSLRQLASDVLPPKSSILHSLSISLEETPIFGKILQLLNSIQNTTRIYPKDCKVLFDAVSNLEKYDDSSSNNGEKIPQRFPRDHALLPEHFLSRPAVMTLLIDQAFSPFTNLPTRKMVQKILSFISCAQIVFDTIESDIICDSTLLYYDLNDAQVLYDFLVNDLNAFFSKTSVSSFVSSFSESEKNHKTSIIYRAIHCTNSKNHFLSLPVIGILHWLQASAHSAETCSLLRSKQVVQVLLRFIRQVASVQSRMIPILARFLVYLLELKTHSQTYLHGIERIRDSSHDLESSFLCIDGLVMLLVDHSYLPILDILLHYVLRNPVDISCYIETIISDFMLQKPTSNSNPPFINIKKLPKRINWNKYSDSFDDYHVLMDTNAFRTDSLTHLDTYTSKPLPSTPTVPHLDNTAIRHFFSQILQQCAPPYSISFVAKCVAALDVITQKKFHDLTLKVLIQVFLYTIVHLPNAVIGLPENMSISKFIHLMDTISEILSRGYHIDPTLIHHIERNSDFSVIPGVDTSDGVETNKSDSDEEFLDTLLNF